MHDHISHQRLYYMYTAHVLHIYIYNPLLDQVNDDFKKCNIDYCIMRSTEYGAEWESLSYMYSRYTVDNGEVHVMYPVPIPTQYQEL